MIKLFKQILIKISKGIYYLIPAEFQIRSSKRILKNEVDKLIAQETISHFYEHFKKSTIINEPWKLRKYAIENSLSNDKDKQYFYLELGTYKGETANFFSKFLNKLYCFDSFEGLREDWLGTGASKGTFNLNKKIPRLNSNIECVVGWVEDTLEEFLKRKSPKINFVHVDLDNYSSVKFSLEKLKPYLVKNSIILFDEYYNYTGWERGEYKAFKEIFSDNEFQYKAFNLESKQCVIQII